MSNISKKSIFSVVIVLYPKMTMLDAIGPLEVFANSKYFKVSFVSSTAHISNDHANLSICGIQKFSDIKEADILLVPGGPGDLGVCSDEHLINWIKDIDKRTIYTTSVCTGSLILSSAGILKGKKSCSHWAYLDELELNGAIPVRRRFIKDDKYITASGVSAGIDMALYILKLLVSKSHAKEVEFGIEYFPNKINLINSYTIPRNVLNRLALKVKSILSRKRNS